jgi:hypothetical protein
MDENRRVRLHAQFEEWGEDRVRADMEATGIKLVGGPPENRDAAWAWLNARAADRKAKAAADAATSRALQRASVTIAGINLGVSVLRFFDVALGVAIGAGVYWILDRVFPP